MTLVEFLHPIIKQPIRDLCLAVLYFEQRYSHRNALTVEEIRILLKRAHAPQAGKVNLADVLAKSAPYVDVAGKQGNRFLWSLTSTGQTYLRSILGLPEADIEIEHDVSSLESLFTSISDKDVAEYIQESVKCLSVGALRAAVVFLWAGAVRKIQEDVMTHGTTNVNAALQKHDHGARIIGKLDDFAYVKESTLLLVAQELGVFDKNEKGTLEEALNLRNKCGHPGKYSPGPKKVSSFIEDVTGIIFA